MFRFSIRELMLVTLVVALAVGWCLRERRLRAAVNRWRSAAATLEYLVEHDDWDVEWERDLSQVRLSRPAGTYHSEQFGLDTDQFGSGPLSVWAESND
jgi:hypothetical protein